MEEREVTGEGKAPLEAHGDVDDHQHDGNDEGEHTTEQDLLPDGWANGVGGKHFKAASSVGELAGEIVLGALVHEIGADLEGAVLELLDLRAVVAHVTELAAEIGDVFFVFELDLVDGAAGEVDAEVQPLHKEGNDAGDDEDAGERVSEFSLTYEIKVHCWPSFRLMP